MAEDLPDAPWTKKDQPGGQDLPDAPWLKETDPGYLAGAGRFVRGAATGLAREAMAINPFMPGPLAEAEKGYLKKQLPEPKDTIESAGEITGEVLPTFAIPSLGFEQAATNFLPQLPRFAGVLGKLADAGLRGTAGAAIQPDASGKNVGIGATTGVSSAAVNSILNVLPWQMRRGLEAVAAGAATWGLTQLGLPKDLHISGPAYWALYQSSLLDLATRINPAFAGAVASRAIPTYMDYKMRNNQ